METSLTRIHNNSSLIHNFQIRVKNILYFVPYNVSLLLIKDYHQMITVKIFSILKVVCFVTVVKESKAKMNENEDA